MNKNIWNLYETSKINVNQRMLVFFPLIFKGNFGFGSVSVRSNKLWNYIFLKILFKICSFTKKKHPEMYSQKALCNVLTWQKTYLNETFFSSFRFLEEKIVNFHNFNRQNNNRIFIGLLLYIFAVPFSLFSFFFWFWRCFNENA